MNALDKKLLRDLWAIRTQALAIAAVIAAGIALLVLAVGTFKSLRLTQQTYYERYGFADVFAAAKRAPLGLERRIAEIPGVAQVETRVVVDVTLDVAGMAEPAKGRLISVPEHARPRLNGLFLRRGRYLEPGRPDEVLVSEAFAEAHELVPGDSVVAVINGRRRRLEIVGVALSPEYVYTISGNEIFPDPRRLGIFWIAREPLASAFEMEGGFNDVAIKLMPGAVEEEVIAQLDALLDRYGGLGAVPRALQISHWYVENEITQLQGTGLIMPLIFLAVAAFLLNVVLTRIVAVQREQIAALKAVGYSHLAIAAHYAKWGLLVAAVGGAAGIGVGTWLSRGLLSIYVQQFRFPILAFHWSWSTIFAALAAGLGAAILGALGAVAQAVRLPPAEAMRPAPPARYRESFVERLGVRRLLSPPVRMIVRNVMRRPLRTALSVIGVSFAVAIMVFGGFMLDAMDVMLEMQFNIAQRHDLAVSFVEPASAGAYYELASLPGVMAVEPSRAVPARLRYGQRSRQAAIEGLPADGELNRVIDSDYRQIRLPPDGIVLSTSLAELLAVERGERLEVEVLEGSRPVLEVVVSDLVEQYLGMGAYMEIDALRRLLREGDTLTGGALQIDAHARDALLAQLKATPMVAGVALRAAAIENFETFLAENIGIMLGFYLTFATIIAFGVVYNGARISLSERSRELASLRVMGFTRGEISFILLGEIALLTLIALPAGAIVGYGLSALAAAAFETELYRIPLVVTPKRYLVSLASVLFATVVSAAIVRRRLHRLDLVAVLKTWE